MGVRSADLFAAVSGSVFNGTVFAMCDSTSEVYLETKVLPRVLSIVYALWFKTGIDLLDMFMIL